MTNENPKATPKRTTYSRPSERENIRNPNKYYDVKTFSKNTKKFYYKFNNDEDHTNKIIFFNGTLGKIKTHNSRYLHYQPYNRIYKKTINTSTINYNDDGERNYYNFNNTLEPLKKVLHSNFWINSYIFEPDEEIFKKIFITTKDQNGQDLNELLNENELINDQFKTHLKFYMNNILSSIHFSTTRSGELINVSYLEVIKTQKENFKYAFKLSTREMILKEITNIYPLGRAYNEDYINKIMNIIDELKPPEKTKEERFKAKPENLLPKTTFSDEHRKEFIRQNNERYDTLKREEEETRQRTEFEEQNRREQEEENRREQEEENKNIVVSFDIVQNFKAKLNEAIKKDNINVQQIDKEFNNKIKEQVKDDIMNKVNNLKDGDELIISTGLNPKVKTKIKKYSPTKPTKRKQNAF